MIVGQLKISITSYSVEIIISILSQISIPYKFIEIEISIFAKISIP